MIYSYQTCTGIHIFTILQTRISVILFAGESGGDNMAYPQHFTIQSQELISVEFGKEQ